MVVTPVKISVTNHLMKKKRRKKKDSNESVTRNTQMQYVYWTVQKQLAVMSDVLRECLEFGSIHLILRVKEYSLL